jgi:hypothetical protein
MKIFVCYARVDKPFCTPFVQKIDHYEYWYDERLRAGDDWWNTIQSHLDWCDCLVYLISHHSVESRYCRSELDIALKLGKVIVPILIDKDTPVPSNIQHLQYADLTSGLHLENTEGVLQALYNIEKRLTEKAETVGASKSKSIRDIAKVDRPHPAEDEPVTIIGMIARAMDLKQFDHAVFLLNTAIERGDKYQFVNLQALLTQASQELEEQVKEREMELEYRAIHELSKVKATRVQGCQAFQNFRKRYPHYDPEKIVDICSSNRPFPVPKPDNVGTLAQETALPNNKTTPKPKTSPLSILSQFPLLEFLPIYTPNGIAPFAMAKFGVTNEQFDRFLNDAFGAKIARWWGFSPVATNWHEKNPHIGASSFGGEHRPRNKISWYDAMAFCYWLSDKLERRIMLPTQQQWRRAAQGTDKRVYPWGNDFDPKFCNARASNINMTTVVNRYPQGASPYGMMDMAGNLWEWCLDGYSVKPDDIKAHVKRAMMGGCYRSDSDHVRITYEAYGESTHVHPAFGFRVIELL